MEFSAVRQIHVACVVLTFALFFIRGLWMAGESPQLTRRWIRIAPHVIDTVLLASAIALVVMSRQYPLTESWLTAKVAGLLVYIVLGSIALKHGRTRGVRLAAWLAAQAVFFYIVAVAITRQPLPWTA